MIVAIVGCTLALTLTMAASPRALAGLIPIEDTQPVDAVRIRLEGYLKAIGPGKWQVDEWTILVDDQTSIIEKRGKAEVGAWVEVWGIRDENGAIYGELIQVDRPAGHTGPILQFLGLLTKKSGQWWVISEMLVEVSETTQIIGTPERGWLVWVVAENQGTMLRALVIEAIADAPASVPVEFEGILESLGPDGWQVAGQVFSLAETAEIIGEPTIGVTVEVLATRYGDNKLIAHLVRVVDSSGQGAASSLTAPRAGAGMPNLLEPDVPASAIIAGHWDAPALVASGLSEAAQPMLAHTSDGIAHALWESNGNIFYAFRAPGQQWSQAQRIASGIEPVLAIDSQDQLHALFANQFLENYEIYHVVYNAGEWTLPINIAHTSGVSTRPALAAGSHGELHATWMDNSPGYSIVYTATWAGGFWTNQPVPSGRGESPAIAVTPGETVFLAWQDRVPTPDNPTGNYSIFLSEQRGDGWSLPINISDRERVDATDVSLTATADGLAHLVWVEGDQTLRYDFGQGLYWPEPRTIAQATMLSEPSILAEGDFLHMAWDEKDTLRALSVPKTPPTWPKPDTVVAQGESLKDVGLAAAQTGGVTLIWVQTTQSNGVSIYESHYEGPTRRSIWLPIMLAG